MNMGEMIGQALWGMAVGIPGVFAVLAIFYVAVRLMMSRVKE